MHDDSNRRNYSCEPHPHPICPPCIKETLNAFEKISRSARVESRRIISERTERAEQILEEIEGIFKKEEISQSDLIKARTLKNKLENISYGEEERKAPQSIYRQAKPDEIKVGTTVFVKPMQSRGQVTSLKRGEAEVQCGSMKMHCKLSDLLLIDGQKKVEKAEKVKVVKRIPQNQPALEINLLGLTVEEALYEVDNFIDRAVLDNLEEIKVIHGVGTGKLKNAIARHLVRHKNVESFRAGRYGEGESGVTVIKLK